MTKLVLEPDTRFAFVEAVLVGRGWHGGPTSALAPLVPGEPELVVWQRGAARLSYTCNPVVWFRLLEGEEVDDDEWVAIAAALPHLSTEGVIALLGEADDELVVLGLYAARALELASALPRVSELSKHPRPLVAGLAESVRAAL